VLGVFGFFFLKFFISLFNPAFNKNNKKFQKKKSINNISIELFATYIYLLTHALLSLPVFFIYQTELNYIIMMY
jgi:hypothetical protein